MKIQHQIALLALFTTILGVPLTHAQTVPISTRIPVADNTIGTQVFGAGGNFAITGGQSRGQNVFHSFQDFSVPTKGSATFLNPIGNRSIITRVTGNQFSDIDGTIDTQGANFFLINPNGMVFGANTKLNVGQTFLGSTANGIDLVDSAGKTINFGTNRSGDAELLTINPNALFNVSRLNMGATLPNSQGIVNYGTIAPNNDNQYVGLIGGNVTLNGRFSGSGVKVSAPGSRIDLGGLNTVGTVTIDKQGLVFEGNNLTRGDVTLNDIAQVYAQKDININSRQLILKDGSLITTSTSSQSKGGNITIKASELVSLGGKVLVLPNGRVLAASIVSQTEGSGDAGNISIMSPVIKLSNASQISADTVASGRGGNLEIVDNKKLVVEGASQISASTAGFGQGGNLIIKTQELELIGSNFGVGSQITTQSGGFIIPGSDPTIGQKNAGNLTIETRKLSVKDGARISTTTFNGGRAGEFNVNASESIELNGAGLTNRGFSGSGLFSDSQAEATGNAGNLNVTTPKLVIRNGAQIGSGTFGKGEGGSLNINASQSIEIDGVFEDIRSGIYAPSEGTGASGNLRIDTDRLQIRNSGSVNVKNLGQKDAGNITVNARLIQLDNKGELIATSNFQNGGNIILQGQEILSLRRNSKISATAGLAGSQGKGGNINILDPNGFIVAAPNENSDITANAFSGSGGKVSIKTQQNFWISPLSRSELEKRLGTTEPNRLNPARLNTNDITAISQVNPDLSGQVSITPPQIDITAGLSPLPNNVTDPTNQINPNCSAKAIANNSFTSVGRGGIPATPKDPLNEQEIAINWVRINPQDTFPSTAIATTTPALSQPIVEAQGWRRERNGDIVLVAVSSSRILPRQLQSGCAVR
jgi:filamentous hemagglutinin family protein